MFMINLPIFTEDRILKPMESGYYTFAKKYASDNQATIESTVKKIAVTASAAMDTKMVEEGLLGFDEGTKVLMNGLDEIAKIHPFIGGINSIRISWICQTNSCRTCFQSGRYVGTEAEG
jgi:hypothetical protein